MINPLIYFLLFLKASLFSFGGLSNLPGLRQDLLPSGWAHEADFGQSVAIGQVSPGPSGLWVISLSYLTYGYLGALLALVAITLPPLLVLGISNIYGQIEHQHWVPGLMRGIALAVVAIQLTIGWVVISQSWEDWRTWLIVIVTVVILALAKRVPLLVILGLAGVIGYILF
jgi:chromate transporter